MTDLQKTCCRSGFCLVSSSSKRTKRGMQITHIDLDLIHNAFQLRCILEMGAIEHFILHATDAERSTLDKNHRDILQEAENGITDALGERVQIVDWAFHGTLIDNLKNKILSDAYMENPIKIRLIRQEVIRIQPENVQSVIGVHLQIIDAINTKDPVKTKAALAEHLATSHARALQL